MRFCRFERWILSFAVRAVSAAHFVIAVPGAAEWYRETSEPRQNSMFPPISCNKAVPPLVALSGLLLASCHDGEAASNVPSATHALHRDRWGHRLSIAHRIAPPTLSIWPAAANIHSIVAPTASYRSAQRQVPTDYDRVPIRMELHATQTDQERMKGSTPTRPPSTKRPHRRNDIVQYPPDASFDTMLHPVPARRTGSLSHPPKGSQLTECRRRFGVISARAT